MKEKIKFEDALQKLEKIVDNLENGTISLDESIEAFKEGNDLVKKCLEKLGSAAKEIQNIANETQLGLDLDD